MGPDMSRFQIVADTLAAELAKPYAHGEADCFLMGLAVADAVTGSTFKDRFAGRYSTLRGAHRVLRNEGHTSLVPLLGTMLDPIAPAMAGLGDLAVIAVPMEDSTRHAEHVGVHDGRQFVVKGEGGVQRFPFSQAAAAFRV